MIYVENLILLLVTSQQRLLLYVYHYSLPFLEIEKGMVATK